MKASFKVKERSVKNYFKTTKSASVSKIQPTVATPDVTIPSASATQQTDSHSKAGFKIKKRTVKNYFQSSKSNLDSNILPSTSVTPSLLDTPAPARQAKDSDAHSKTSFKFEKGTVKNYFQPI